MKYDKVTEIKELTWDPPEWGDMSFKNFTFLILTDEETGETVEFSTFEEAMDAALKMKGEATIAGWPK